MTVPLRVILVTGPAGEEDLRAITASLALSGLQPAFDRVTTAESLHRQVADNAADVILLNDGLPELSLLHVLKIASHARPRRLPVILISDLTNEARIVDALHEGATDFVCRRNLTRLGPAVSRALSLRINTPRPSPGYESRTASGRSVAEDLLGARLRLSDLAGVASLEEVMRAAVDAAERFTGSCFGFFHFLDGHEKNLTLQVWSSRTLRELAPAGIPSGRLPISAAGVWADCLESRAPVIHNDYARHPHRRGLLEGRAAISRELVVPLLRGEGVFAILGVANKATDYADPDIEVVQSFASIIADLVERKRAEAALRASEERVRAVLDSVPAGIFLETHGRFAYANRHAATLLKAESVEQLLDRSVLERFIPENRERLAERFMKLYAEDGPMPPAEETCRCLDGSTFDAEVSAVPFRQNGHRGALVFFSDITHRRRLESQLRQAQKMEAVGQLAGGVAHDFNNILTAIFMHLGLLEVHPCLDTVAHEMVRELGTEARRAAALTRQLLLFGRRSVIQFRPLDINELVENMLRMLRRLIGEHIDLSFLAGAALPRIAADPGMLEQILLNIAVNARDAMPRGGQLTISTQVARIGAETLPSHPGGRPGEFLCLDLTDTGCGMNETVLKHLFEPFYTTKPVGQGTGLGLATVYSIVQQHQGWIEVESAPNQGSTFRVYIPTTLHSAVPENPETPAAPSSRRGTETILLVEDERVVRKTIGIYLRRNGYRVIEAADGLEALSAWKQYRDQVDLLFTDMVMPGGLTGLELVERLRAEKPDLRAIVSSGYSADLLQAGNNPVERLTFVAKPCPPIELLSAVRASLDAHRPR